MNVLQVLIPVLLGLALVGYLIYETKRHLKKKAEEAEYEKQLELEQALTLDKKYEEDSIITVNVPNTSGQGMQISLISIDSMMIIRTLSLVVGNTIEVSEEDQLKLLVALANLDFDLYIEFCEAVEDTYFIEELKAA